MRYRSGYTGSTVHYLAVTKIIARQAAEIPVDWIPLVGQTIIAIGTLLSTVYLPV